MSDPTDEAPAADTRLDLDTRQHGTAPPFLAHEGDHTALVHVLWAAKHRGLTLQSDCDEIATMVLRSRWLKAQQHFAVAVSAADDAEVARLRAAVEAVRKVCAEATEANRRWCARRSGRGRGGAAVSDKRKVRAVDLLGILKDVDTVGISGDPRVDAAARSFDGNGSYPITRGHVDAADAYDRAHGIVRVDCGREDTVERAARALHAVEYGTRSAAASADHNQWTWDGDGTDEESRDYWRRLARAVLSELRKGEKA